MEHGWNTDARRNLIYKEKRKSGKQEGKLAGDEDQKVTEEETMATDLTREGCVLKFGLVGDWNEEVLPSDLIASREWEAALIFDKMVCGVVG